MSKSLPLYDSYIAITTSDDYKDIFHKKTIFRTLTNEHFLKLLFLQKIKIKSNNFTRVYIFLDCFDLKNFNLKDKLYYIAKYKSENFGIFFKDIDEIDKYKKDIQKYSIFIDTYSKKKPE